MAITSGQQGQSATGSSRLYLYSFVATLVLIVAVTFALSLRVWLHRRRLRALLHDAAAEGANYERFAQMARARGVRVPPALLAMMGAPTTAAGLVAVRRARKEVKLGRTPGLWESRLQAEPDLDDEKGRWTSTAVERHEPPAWQPLFVSLPSLPTSTFPSHPAPYTPFQPPPTTLQLMLSHLLPRARNQPPPPPPPPPPAFLPPSPAAAAAAANLPVSEERLDLLLDQAASAGSNPVLVGVLIRPPEDPAVRHAREERQRAALEHGDEDEEPLVEVELGWTRLGLAHVDA